MNTKEIIERRVDVSADISYYVYKFENSKSHISNSQLRDKG